MKKISVLGLAIIASVLLMSSCQSSGPKCPGMYGQIDDTHSIEQVKETNSAELNWTVVIISIHTLVEIY